MLTLAPVPVAPPPITGLLFGGLVGPTCVAQRERHNRQKWRATRRGTISGAASILLGAQKSSLSRDYQVKINQTVAARNCDETSR